MFERITVLRMLEPYDHRSAYTKEIENVTITSRTVIITSDERTAILSHDSLQLDALSLFPSHLGGWVGGGWPGLGGALGGGGCGGGCWGGGGGGGPTESE